MGFGVTGGYLLGFVAGWGPQGLWWGLALGLGVSALLLIWRFHIKTWRLARGVENVATSPSPLEGEGRGEGSRFVARGNRVGVGAPIPLTQLRLGRYAPNPAHPSPSRGEG